VRQPQEGARGGDRGVLTAYVGPLGVRRARGQERVTVASIRPYGRSAA
jgi:hypothetical protein